ncbi:uncharacterized protein EDB91DRAFT_95844 [Suillus paluster]|uniref:uncharacterized protein n=1 Tax=Suillus paluster TaxID=48578 RepID=UPI001B886E5F|nr:uncharacterized protein EDB91DRAFT_95844 [Suillus paluster]KAG1725262.1 hypothetical protein EDB91DRAFT_95844 [Suillus paluster]
MYWNNRSLKTTRATDHAFIAETFSPSQEQVTADTESVLTANVDSLTYQERSSFADEYSRMGLRSPLVVLLQPSELHRRFRSPGSSIYTTGSRRLHDIRKNDLRFVPYIEHRLRAGDWSEPYFRTSCWYFTLTRISPLANVIRPQHGSRSIRAYNPCARECQRGLYIMVALAITTHRAVLHMILDASGVLVFRIPLFSRRCFRGAPQPTGNCVHITW